MSLYNHQAAQVKAEISILQMLPLTFHPQTNNFHEYILKLMTDVMWFFFSYSISFQDNNEKIARDNRNSKSEK